MEEKKTEDRSELLNAETEETASAPESGEEKEERRGMFGAKKRERNDRMIMGLYGVAGVYLLYTAYMTAKELIDGRVKPGRDTVISIAFVVIFVVAAIWILISSWRLRNMLKAKDQEEAEKLAAEMAERGEEPEEPVKGGLLGGLLTKPDVSQPSVASRASVYYNPADDEEEEATDESLEETADEAAGETLNGEKPVSDENGPGDEDIRG